MFTQLLRIRTLFNWCFNKHFQQESPPAETARGIPPAAQLVLAEAAGCLAVPSPGWEVGGTSVLTGGTPVITGYPQPPGRYLGPEAGVPPSPQKGPGLETGEPPALEGTWDQRPLPLEVTCNQRLGYPQHPHPLPGRNLGTRDPPFGEQTDKWAVTSE